MNHKIIVGISVAAIVTVIGVEVVGNRFEPTDKVISRAPHTHSEPIQGGPFLLYSAAGMSDSTTSGSISVRSR